MARDAATTWELIHAERAALVDELAGLTPEQWEHASACGSWSVHKTAAHVLAGAEQTPGRFFARLAASGLRFNSMIERDAERLAALSSDEIVERLKRRTATTNHPPAPIAAMLGEVVVHGEDIRRPLELSGRPEPAAVRLCLEMFSTSGFPVGGKRRVEGLRLQAGDVEWSHGTGPEVRGPSRSLLMAVTGRPIGLADLEGRGVRVLSERMG